MLKGTSAPKRQTRVIMKPYDTHDEQMRRAWIMEQPDLPDEMGVNKIALARPLAWSLAALSLTLTVGGLAVRWRAGPQWLVTPLLFGPATTITYALVGALVASRQPRNPIGWIFSTEGVLYGLVILATS